MEYAPIYDKINVLGMVDDRMGWNGEKYEIKCRTTKNRNQI